MPDNKNQPKSTKQPTVLTSKARVTQDTELQEFRRGTSDRFGIRGATRTHIKGLSENKDKSDG